MTEFYSEGSIAVTAGSVDFVGAGTTWLPINAKAGDTLNVAGHVMLLAELTDPTHGKFAIPYPGETAAGLAYAIAKTSSEWGTNRTLALQTAEMIQLLTTVVVERTGIAFNAYGTYAARDTHDEAAGGFVYLSIDGDTGATTTAWTLFIKLSADEGDWDAGQPIEGSPGAPGAPGEPGLIGTWCEAWAIGTNYAELDAVAQGGSSYICEAAHVSGDFATDLAAGKWRVVAQRGADGSDGVDGVDGEKGDKGDIGGALAYDARGTFAGRATHDAAAAEFVYLSTDGDGATTPLPVLFVKNSATAGDWSAPVEFVAPPAAPPAVASIIDAGGIAAGEYLMERWAPGAGTHSRLRAEVRSGADDATIAILVNGDVAIGPVIVEAGTPLEQAIALELAQDDEVELALLSVGAGDVDWLIVQLDTGMV